MEDGSHRKHREFCLVRWFVYQERSALVETPRVAIYYWVVAQTGYRNDGACLFMNYNLRKLLNGCKTQEEVKADMPNHDRNVRHLMPWGDISKFGTYDLHLLIDHGEDAIGVPLDFEYPHPNAYWVSDAHLGYTHRLETAKKFDFIFCCQKRAMEEFIRDGIPAEKVMWLPHAAEPDCYKPIPIVERWDWCFIGHLNSPHRIELLDAFCKDWPLGEYGYLGWRDGSIPGRNVMDDANKKYNQARLIVSDSISDDINMRVFETLAARRCLLTNAIPTLPLLFEPGRHLVTYGSVAEAKNVAHYLLCDPRQLQTLAENGHREVMAKHTYMHRAKTILKTCLNWEREPDDSKGELIHAD